MWLHCKSEDTRGAYRSDLSKFVDLTGGKPLKTVALADIQEFANFVSEVRTPSSQARLLAALKSLFAFGHQVGYLPFEVIMLRYGWSRRAFLPRILCPIAN